MHIKSLAQCLAIHYLIMYTVPIPLASWGWESTWEIGRCDQGILKLQIPYKKPLRLVFCLYPYNNFSCLQEYLMAPCIHM